MSILTLDMDIPTVQPSRLKKGDVISIVAPSSPIESRDGLDKGIASLERMGFRVRFHDRIFQSSRYLAGNDPERAEELMQAFEDPSVQAIISLRGGYGCARLIPLLKDNRLRPYPKIFIGFSDLTTLHLYFHSHFGWATIHGPMVASPALHYITPQQEQNFLSLITDPNYRPALSFPQLETWFPGKAEGTLIGGCLSLITASIGTAYEIKTEGKILFLEDQGEAPYRLDRMLTHLRLAGKLHSLAGILLGDFPDCEPTQGNYTSSEILREILADLKIPTIANFPSGHGSENWAIPLGVKVFMDADKGSIRYLESAVH
jgi:muramoyltetrapeptide carboxypeptidase